MESSELRDHPDNKWITGIAIAAILCFAKVLFHFVFTGKYGYFRDELYYLACADHMSWGYVDQPPFSIAVLGLVRWLLGDSLFVIRLVPGLVCSATMILAALIARELGGGRLAQATAALATLLSPIYLAHSTFYSMNSLDVFLSTLLLFILARIINTESSKLWIVFGLVAGIGLLNKFTTAIFGAALVAGLILTRHRRFFNTKWLYLGGAIAALLFLPHLIWQWQNHWPFVEFISNAKNFKMAAMPPFEFLGAQILLLGPAAFPLCLGGLFFFLFAKSMSRYRIFGIIFVATVLIIFIQSGKSYYLAPFYTILFAGGAVTLETLKGRLAWKIIKPAYLVLLVAASLIPLPMAVPIMAPESYIRYSSAIGLAPPRDEKQTLALLPQHFADRFGWKEMVSTIAGVYDQLSEDDKARCALLTGNYGEAGAIDFFGPSLGLPKAISPHNSYWLWGPRDATGEVVIVIGYTKEELEPIFKTVEEKARTHSKYAMPYENNLPIYLCRDIKMPVGKLWPTMKHYI